MSFTGQREVNWRTELSNNLIERCIDLNDSLFGKLNVSSNLRKQTINDLNSRKGKIIGSIKNMLQTESNNSDLKKYF